MLRRSLPPVLLALFSLPAFSEGLTMPENAAEAQAWLEEAGNLRARADARRIEAQAAFDRAEEGCQQKFFINACRNQARDALVERLRQARTLEAEANQRERMARHVLTPAKPAP